MKEYINQNFTGERALFNTRDARIIECKFFDGESPLKESCDYEVKDSIFEWKYPMWYSNNVKVENTTLFETARSGIWYTNNMVMNNSNIFAPKTFRRCNNITLNHVNMSKALETFWNCNGIYLNDCFVKGDYFGMNSQNIEANNLVVDGNYVFDGAKNITINNSRLLSKDAFWNCENVVVKNSYIVGEYLCWNTKNIRFVNCVIESLQGMCYVDELILEDCKLLNTTLAFEYSNVDARIDSVIDSIKNPNSGSIEAIGVKEIIFDENIKTSKEATKILVK